MAVSVWSNWQTSALAVILLLSIEMRNSSLRDQGLWHDASDRVDIAPLSSGELSHAVAVDGLRHLTLCFLIQKPGVALFQEMGTRFPATCFRAVAVALMAWTRAESRATHIGLPAALVLAVHLFVYGPS